MTDDLYLKEVEVVFAKKVNIASNGYE